MCVVSMVMDQWSPHVPYPPPGWPVIPPVIPPVVPPPAVPFPVDDGRVVPEYDNDALRELLDSLRAAVAAAEKLDRITGQPDCVDPEKEKLMERVEELERRLDAVLDAAEGAGRGEAAEVGSRE